MKYLRIMFGGFAAITTISLGALYTYQNKLIYPSWAMKARVNVDTPASRNLPYEHVWLTTSDGVKLEAYDLQNPSPESKSTVVILCPNAGNIGYFIPIVEFFYRSYNMSVFIYSYRGYGHSEGEPSETGLKLDADAAMQYLTNNEFHKGKKLVLYGRSLGGANAIYIAAKYSTSVDAVVLENTFLSIRKVIPYMFPFLSSVAFLCHEVWDSETEITKCQQETPFLFLSGQMDEIVPPEHMKRLLDLCPSRDKHLFEFPNGHHNDTIAQSGYWQIVWEFLSTRGFI